MFYLITFIVPVILLAFLNVCVFILPADSGEKTGYAIILFLTFSIYLLIVTDTMPEGMSTVPIISIYLLLECVLSTLILFITIAQLRLHGQSEDSEVPGFYQFIVVKINSLKRKLGFDREKNAKKKKKNMTKKKTAAISDEEETKDIGKQQEIKGTKAAKALTTSKVTPTPSYDALTDVTGSSRNRTSKQSNPSPNNAGGSSSSSSGIHSGESEETPEPDTEEARSGLVRQKTILSKGGPPVNTSKPSFPTAKDLDDYRKTPMLLTDLEAPTNHNGSEIDGHFQQEGGRTVGDSITPNIHKRRSSMFAAVKQMPLDIKEEPEHESSDEAEEKKEISWSDVTTALDIFFFCTFIIINTLLTIITYIVAATGGNSQ